MASVTPTTDEFHYFKKLPPELRIKIWELARPDPRVIRIGAVSKRPHPYIAKVPAILHTCRESRVEGQRMYDFVYTFYRTSYIHGKEPQKGRRGTFFDGSYDILYVDKDFSYPLSIDVFMGFLKKAEHLACTRGTTVISPDMCDNCTTFTEVTAPATLYRVAKRVGAEGLSRAFWFDDCTGRCPDASHKDYFTYVLAKFGICYVRQTGMKEVQLVLDEHRRKQVAQWTQKVLKDKMASEGEATKRKQKVLKVKKSSKRHVAMGKQNVLGKSSSARQATKSKQTVLGAKKTSKRQA